MTVEEINKYIHEKILGKCWHEINPLGKNWHCIHCDTWDFPDLLITGDTSKDVHGLGNPNYCSDDSPRKLLNEVSQKIINAYKNSLGDNLPYYFFLPHSSSAQKIAAVCVKTHKALYPDIEELRKKFLGNRTKFLENRNIKNGLIKNSETGLVEVWENGIKIGEQG